LNRENFYFPNKVTSSKENAENFLKIFFGQNEDVIHLVRANYSNNNNENYSREFKLEELINMLNKKSKRKSAPGMDYVTYDMNAQ
jgi:hypothetical protein